MTVPVRERLPALDVLRGIAILGTLATNIWIFTHPHASLAVIHGHFGAAAARGPVEAVLQQLPQGKFLGLLALLFGIGLAIQQRSARTAGRRWPGPYLWRPALLFVDGLLHYLLVFEYDILMGYAVSGAVVAWLLATSDRSQRAWMWTAACLHLALLSLLSLGAMVDDFSDGPLPAFNPYVDGSWWQLVQLRLRYFLLFRAEAMFVFCLTVALFLAGARLHARGVLAPEGAGLRRRLMIIGFGIGLPLDLLIGLGGGMAGGIFARYATAPLISLGLLALVAQWHVSRPAPGAAGRWMADLGRVALSGYVLQNLIASTLCYGWGLGLAGRMPEALRVPGTIVMFLAVSALVLVFARLWLRRFRHGPLEWLWQAGYRRLTGGRSSPRPGSDEARVPR